MTTTSVNNSFIQNGMVLDGAVYNITGCTFNTITIPWMELSTRQDI
jgi:hypothetical protein